MNARAVRAVFLDRDGILNRTEVVSGVPVPPASVDAVVIDESVRPALERLKAAGYVLICVTNQPDVARGTATRCSVDAINAHVRDRLPLDDLRCCFHDSSDRCACRKPAPGMLLAAAEELRLDLGRSAMVGDRCSDVAAGRAAGCRTVLVGDAYGQSCDAEPDLRVPTLDAAVDALLR